ncbi:MAG: Precorrin-3B methylase [Cyanobacteria bacterium J06638_28]
MSSFEPPLQGDALIKEVCRRIRVARSYWDAHNNAACRKEREKALALYNTLTTAEKEKIPQVLRVWLRYRSEKYFGAHRTTPGSQHRSSKGQKGGKQKKGRSR